MDEKEAKFFKNHSGLGKSLAKHRGTSLDVFGAKTKWVTIGQILTPILLYAQRNLNSNFYIFKYFIPSNMFLYIFFCIFNFLYFLIFVFQVYSFQNFIFTNMFFCLYIFVSVKFFV